MAASTKMSVDISAFKQGMQEATARVKTLDAEMKKAEAQFKSTGDAEAYMTQKAQTLQEKIKAQKDAVANLEKAMKAMKDNGVSETSAQYQKLAERLATAQAAMIETTTELNNLGQSEQTAARGADQLTQSVNGIGKKISLDQVISGISTITGGLEKAAGKAVDLGKALWDNVMDSARWADDTATMALMYGVDLDTFLRVQKLVAEGMDTSVEAILNSQARLKKNIGGGSSSIMQTLRELGISMTTLKDTGGGILEFVPKDADTVFWEVGRAIMNLGDEFEKENKAQQLFGKGWKELVPLFSQFKNQEEYNKALQETTVNTEEEVSKLAELNDAVGDLKSNFDVLEQKVMAELAPALTEASNALSGLLENLIAYLETPAGQEALTKMSDAVSGLFEDLGKIDPDQVVEGFSKVFGDIVDGIRWLDENKETLKNVLTVIVGGWGAAKLTNGALEVKKLVDGIMGLAGVTGGGVGGVATGVGGAIKTALAAGLKAAAPALGVTALALTPAILAQNATWAESESQRQARIGAVGTSQSANAEFVRKAAEAVTIRNGANADFGAMEALLMGLSSRKNQQKAELYNVLQNAAPTAGSNTWGLLNRLWGGEAMDSATIHEMLENITDAFAAAENKVQVPVEPTVEDGAAEAISQEIGAVPVTVIPQIAGFGSHVNGLPFAPYDGYIAELHRGERVMTASENRNYTFNSNTYFGNVNLNNGMQVEALSESIARQNRKIQRGFGS